MKKAIRASSARKSSVKPLATVSTAKRRERQYTIDDLSAMAAQLGCRVRFDLTPKEYSEEARRGDRVAMFANNLTRAILWALGEHETFTAIPEDWPKRPFYWRKELREKYNAAIAQYAANGGEVK